MVWWVEEEIRKYKNKKVEHQGAVWIVKEVFWLESSEEFLYYIENNKGKFAKVYEANIKLITS